MPRTGAISDKKTKEGLSKQADDRVAHGRTKQTDRQAVSGPGARCIECLIEFARIPTLSLFLAASTFHFHSPLSAFQ